jgi:hypothetical protein
MVVVIAQKLNRSMQTYNSSLISINMSITF